MGNQKLWLSRKHLQSFDNTNDFGDSESDLEDLALPNCPLREPDQFGRRGCLSSAWINDGSSGLYRGHHSRLRGTKVRSSAGAEKDSEGMALKI
jgi:hypothetical protein